LPPGFEQAPPLLAMGATQKSTFCLLRKGEAILSQHIGDLDNAATQADYRKMLALYRDLFQFTPGAIVVDNHPDYPSSRWGEETAETENAPLLRVQHHHAHIAAGLAEIGHARDAGPVLGVALDGLGLGDDGTLWGGEFLRADYTEYHRLAHFSPVPMPGGDTATREPWRNAYAHITRAMGWEAAEQHFSNAPLITFLRTKPLHILDIMMKRGLNAPEASSAGRLFDAVAATIGVCRKKVSYEGQAAIQLEALAALAMGEAGKTAYAFDIVEGSPLRFGFASLWQALLTDVSIGIPAPVIAARFHLGLIAAVSKLTLRLAKEHDLQKVILTGGVFQNRLLGEGVLEALGNAGLSSFVPSTVPANDGGIALGQALIAAARLEKKGY
jgi:hydrogenase maturation protein HypF